MPVAPVADDLRVCYTGSPMNITRCQTPDCTRFAFCGTEHCLDHHADLDAAHRSAVDLLRESPMVSDLAFDGLVLTDADLSHRVFLRCSFRRATLERVSFADSVVDLCLFDFATLTGTSFHGADVRRSVFGGATITACTFNNAELVECNFNGACCRGTTFNDSDLRGSRFIAATLHTVEMRNCNLKEAHFGNAVRAGCDFKYSNPEEAYMRLPGRRV